jgi:hypothetical protein
MRQGFGETKLGLEARFCRNTTGALGKVGKTLLGNEERFCRNSTRE